MNFSDWLKLIGIGAGVGTSLYGANQANSAAQQQNQLVAQSQAKLYALADQERQRQSSIFQLMMPSILRDMGIKGDPAILGQLYGQVGSGANPTPASNTVYPGQSGASAPSTAANAPAYNYQNPYAAPAPSAQTTAQYLGTNVNPDQYAT